MNTFTFDNFFYFDRQPNDENWYVYTHPQTDPFLHGQFSVVRCTFVSHSGKLGRFDETQICEIERLLAVHRDEMNLQQFEIHKTCPAHYREISPVCAPFRDLLSRMRNGGKWDPRFSVAWDKLTAENPAYRLNRKFVSRVIRLASEISRDEWMAALREDCEDTWTYDISPYQKEDETFESFFTETVDTIYLPTEPDKHAYKVRRIYSIDSLPSLFLIAHSRDTFFYYEDLGNVVVPVFLPPHSGWMPNYII